MEPHFKQINCFTTQTQIFFYWCESRFFLPTLMKKSFLLWSVVSKQWAAVITQMSLIREPPQKGCALFRDSEWVISATCKHKCVVLWDTETMTEYLEQRDKPTFFFWSFHLNFNSFVSYYSLFSWLSKCKDLKGKTVIILIIL